MKTLHQQQGATLLLSLVFLLMVTVMSLASIQGVKLQQSMSTNLNDRALAFQAAESALRSVEVILESTATTLSTINCSLGSNITCPPVPSNTFLNDDAGWSNVPEDFRTNITTAAGIPQYHIQLLGSGVSSSSIGQNNNLNNTQYGVNNGVPTEQFYRITVRSSNPGIGDGRAIVVLQTTIKRNI
ncbi:pilus assembly PilX family protein [Thiothrix lacustris]|uniref:pilus assembly PilX family protein n=1 Tax=Thiothrix lacustris TaxID=525917 RepID=UPI00048F8577|nr:PilX N-terminal domain-containing pilus assembly protein [Thiothrix lacustris]